MSDYLTHPEWLALLRGILENPADDAPRWIIADWLDDHDEPERAAFIRASLADPYGHQYTGDAHIMRHNRPHVGDLSGLPESMGLQSHRGFVRWMSASCAAFMAHAATLFVAHPITAVVLTDKQPLQVDDAPERGQRTFAWFSGPTLSQTSPHHLPDPIIYDCRGWYPTRELAIGALSLACVRHGRKLAGLPTLTGL